MPPEEERLRALEERVKGLEQRLRSGRPLTDNLLASATDLDDFGSVKTYLEFEEPTLAPLTPPTDVLRAYAKAQSSRSVLAVVDDQGNTFTLLMRQDGAAISVAEGTGAVTINNGTRVGSLTVTHNIGWTSTGRVWLTVQQITNVADAEMPVGIGAYSVGANSFAIRASSHAAVGANRTFNVAWLASGVL